MTPQTQQGISPADFKETTTEAPIDYGQFWQGRVVSYTKDGVTQLGHIQGFIASRDACRIYIVVDWSDGGRSNLLPHALTLL